MKILDANVLLYSVNRDSHHYPVAHRWLRTALSGEEAIGFPWVCLLAFIRIATNPRIFDAPLTPSAALDLADLWLAQPVAMPIEPTQRHPSILRRLLEDAGTAGNLTTDAHVAALAIEHGADLVSFDRDFARFRVRLHVPQ